MNEASHVPNASAPSIGTRRMLLRSVALFAGFDGQVLDALVDLTTVKRYPKGTVVFNEGAHANSLYLIVSGIVEVLLISETGRERALKRCGPGEYFGEIALLDDAGRSASVMVLESCELIVISRHAFRQLMVAQSEIADRVIEQLTQRVRSLALGTTTGGWR